MKIIQTILLVCFVVVSATAQRADVKGPKAKNMKVYQNSELFSGTLVSQNQPVLKGPERKNFTYANVNRAEQATVVSSRPQVYQGPKAKNRKAWQ